VDVFAQRGFYQSTIAHIARQAGVADGTIYLYFRNKEDILVQFFNFKAKMVFDRFKEEVKKGHNAADKLKHLIRIHLDEFQKDRSMALVYQVEMRRRSRVAEDQIKTMSKMYLNLVAEIIEQGQEEGRIRKDLYVSLVKRFIVGAIDEVINTWLHADREYDLVTMTDPLLDLFLSGIGTASRDSGHRHAEDEKGTRRPNQEVRE
jgi:TetR/AcrR family fatty acid metabolism transcriptional regulator